MAADFNIKPHEEQWHGFVKLMTYGTVGVVLILVLMALTLL